MNADTGAYLDSSAIVKLLLDEVHSAALRKLLLLEQTNGGCWSSELAFTEVSRGLMREDVGSDSGRGEPVWRELLKFGLIAVDRPLRLAARLPGANLRSLDAIHIATALRLRKSLGRFITYDDRQAEAARSLGLDVIQPGLD